MINRTYVLTFLVVLGLTALAQAQTFTTLYSFTGGSDGDQPYAGVIRDAAGQLYGTTVGGGDLGCDRPYGCGVVYKLDRAGHETVLYSFSGSPDGESPFAPVARDKAGNLYGTTVQGGSSNCAGGCGTVFKIDTSGNETVLYSFTGGSDGCWPMQGLVVGKSDTLFGTTTGYGCSGYGTVFKVDSAGNFSLLHSFGGPDGAYPTYGHLTMDKSGNLYGLTEAGGTYGYGVLYKLSKNGTLTLMHGFNYGVSDGCWPYGSAVPDKAGNLYGTTYQCGANNYGTIWKVSNNGKETILHNFAGNPSDGCYPLGGVTLDSKGNLYGVTYVCGADNYGTLYRLSAKGSLTLLHSFDGSDGVAPQGEVLRTCKGVLFGTTRLGVTGGCGGYGCGTVWSYVP